MLLQSFLLNLKILQNFNHFYDEIQLYMGHLYQITPPHTPNPTQNVTKEAAVGMSESEDREKRWKIVSSGHAVVIAFMTSQ